MNVLVLGCLTRATGNAVTARRVAEHLATRHPTTLVDTNSVGRAASLAEVVSARNIDLAVGVHALLAGPFLRGCGVPYGIVFGGTDLYEPAHALHARQMALAVEAAVGLVAFSDENARRAGELWPRCAPRVRVVAQATEGRPERGFSLRARLGLGANDVVLLLPAGLRRAKDPTYLLDAVAAWHAVDGRVHLVVVGDALEPGYAEDALAKIARTPGLHHLPTLPRVRFLAAVRDADLVLNSSVSEGMCGALLEAMRLETPVVARRNAGNAALIAHGRTGFLYDSPEELVAQCRSLLKSAALRGAITSNARRAIGAAHAPARERAAYLQLVDDIARSSLADSARMSRAC